MKRLLILAAIAALSICLGARAANEDKTWMVVDIKTGAVDYYDFDFDTATNIFNAPVYKTEAMVFRRIPAGLYHVQDGTARAFIENDYYLSIFPVTVGQHACMTNLSAKVYEHGQYIEGMQQAQTGVSWRNWRGAETPGTDVYFTNVGADDAEYGDSPLSALAKWIRKVSYGDVSLHFDFPTRAMWEVAARAMPADDGSRKTWKWFWGETLDGAELYANTNAYYGSQPVGSRLPNDWGFYDLYGTCWEWCRDGTGAVPVGSRDAALFEHSELPRMPDADDPDRRLFCGSADSGASYSGDASKNARWIGARIAVLLYKECSAAPVTITYRNETGETLQPATEVPFGGLLRSYYNGPEPTKAGNEQYYYTFAGWDQNYAASNAVATAMFARYVHRYEVDWVNWDGSRLTSDIFDYGDSPYYPGATPTKPSTVEYEYTFTGWNPEPAAVTGETTYVAQFMQSARKYDIAWLNYDGSTNATSLTSYNTIPEFVGETPAKPSTVQYAYTFAGWTPVLEPATSNTAYTAVFDESIREYPVNFYNNTGSELLFTTNVPYGSTPEYLGETPTNPSTAQYHYSFAGWGRDMRVVDGPSFYNDYYAEFDPILRSYDITWANYDGTVLCVTNVPYGTTPAYNGATPTKPQTVTSQFAFSGWTETVVSVTGAATYTAAYAETPRPYPVTWLNYDGTVLCVTNIPYGEIPAYLGATPKKESAYRCHYEFSGWTPELAAVTEAGATYTATFNEVIDLLAHLTFDDYGNDGLNVLKATFGEDGIVRTTQANVVEGLGAVTPVTDASILAGLPEGDGAVAIPVNTHIALPIPAALASESGKPWSISMKVKFPSFGRYYSVFTMPAANNSDMMVFLRSSATPTIALKQVGGRVDGSGGFTAGQWETLLFLFDSGRTRVLLNGKQIFSYAYTLAGSRADCANAGGYILLAGDEDGEDAFMYWADVRVYDGIVDDTRGWDHATVTWRNYDGTLLATEDVSCGVTPVYKGAKPSKPTSLPSYFVFSGWTEEVVPVTGDVTYTAKYTENTLPQGNTWMVVDLPTGDATYFGGDLGDATNAFNTSEFKTTKMVFRRVPEGFYWCRGGAHVSSVEQAIMGRPYYIGMFPVTEAQYALMLDPTATVTPNATNLRPQANVSYSDLRGSAEVPSAFGEGLADGPIYRLNAHAQDALGMFDLPTVAMWEVASRAMPSGDDSHKDWQYTFAESSYDNLYKYSWFYGTMNVDDGYGNMTGRRVVGTKLPNDWGLYDMPGNVWDWCLDNCSDKISRSQTPRKTSGNVQLMGGSYTQTYDRNYVYSQAEKQPTTTGENVGFRLAMISDDLPTYTITWRDYDGTVLATDKFARSLEGVTPTYSGRAPKRPGHYFTGWSPAVAIVETDAVYTADYRPMESGQSLVDLSTLAANYTAQDGDVLIDKTTYAVSIADGATVTLAEMSSPGLTCLGNATIVIADNTENTLNGTLRIGGTGTTLTIRGNTGSLNVMGDSHWSGIGRSYNGGNAGGDVVINGGIITTIGGEWGYGIGGGAGACGNIIINGGTITAVGGTDEAPGIGTDGDITITGGTVTAIGNGSPGIGQRRGGSKNSGNITISGGTVNAIGSRSRTMSYSYMYNETAIGGYCGEIRIESTVTKVIAAIANGTPIYSVDSANYPITIAEGLQELNLNLDGRNTRMIGPDLTANITWKDSDGTVLCTTKAPYATTPVYPDTPPTNNLPSHVFAGWSPRPAAVFDDVTYTATYGTELTWMVVDLRTGATSYYGYDLDDATNVFNTVEYKTAKMVFRRVPEGRYYVRNSAAVATMGRPYYIGMFPVTVAQYNLMLDPSAVVSEPAEDMRAIVNVSYATLRGSQNVPTAFGGGLGDGPISRLNTRVTAKLGPFDLPTESMWEVAARAIEAGAETNKTWPWFFGVSASPLSQYAFFNGSSEADAYGLTSGSRVPGGKLANAWGLFDIYGNVWERCLDSCPGGQSSETMSLSQVPKSGYPYIRQLGGSFGNDSDRCRTSDGGGWQAVTETSERSGFRLAMISDELPTYTVTLCDDDGTVLATDRFAKTLEGVMPTFYMPSKRAGYYIAGWAQTAKDADNITYTAVYKRGQIVDVGKLTAYTAKDGDMLIGATGYAVTIADGATVTLAGVTITKGSGVAIGCQGDATIILADGSVNTVTGQPGVQLPENADKTLTITVPDDGEGTGALTAIALWGSAAIGQCWYENGHATLGHLVINGGHITANADGNGAGIGGGTGFNAGCTSSIGNITINGGTVIATGYNGAGIGGGVGRGHCGNIMIGSGVAKIVATTTNAEQPIGNGNNSSFCSGVTVASNLKQTYSDNGRTLTIEPDVKETTVTVGGVSVAEVVRGEDGKTLSFAVAAGTVAGDVKLDIGGVDVTKGFRVTVNGTEARAVLLAPYAVPKEEGAADEIWTENGDGTVTLNVTVVPGLYYAADSAESIDALACPGASAPATGATTLTAPKPVGDTGFFKVWVSDAPIPATP